MESTWREAKPPCQPHKVSDTRLERSLLREGRSHRQVDIPQASHCWERQRSMLPLTEETLSRKAFFLSWSQEFANALHQSRDPISGKSWEGLWTGLNKIKGTSLKPLPWLFISRTYLLITSLPFCLFLISWWKQEVKCGKFITPASFLGPVLTTFFLSSPSLLVQRC